MANAPQGTISFLFTDIVGSTRLWERFPTEMGTALAHHDALIRSAVEARGGHVFKTVGDAFCVAFETPRDALAAALDAQRKLAETEWGAVGSLPVRMGMHTGAAEFRDNDYFGGTLNRAARIESAAHGGQILVSQVSMELLEDEAPDGVSFKLLGSFHLRNLARPEHLFQVLAKGLEDSFPPPLSMEVLPNNLPVQTTSFVGREKEMEDVRRLLEGTRLLTLTGSGGTGKTRLALEVGAQLINEFPDGVWLVELAPISDADRIVETLAGAIGAREEPDRPLRETLVRFLRAKHLLLLLDNCEHLHAGIAALAAELLRAAPKLKILATSRHSLGIAGEAAFFVPPLRVFDTRLESLSGPDIVTRLTQFDAVKLFIARAVAALPNFTVTNENAPSVAEICSRLDGIPLAIELAAARVKLLSVKQIAERLGDRFHLLRGNRRDGLPHQQTLQALIDWSHDLLSEQERIVFRRLGAFVGGRTLEALEAVCSGDGIEEFEVLDLLQQLVDKSLVTVERDPSGATRYTMIESVWQYARDKLDSSGEAGAVRDRHLDYFVRWAEMVSSHLQGPAQKAWLDRCQAEHLNLRLALERAIESRRVEPGFRIVTATYRAIEIRSNLAEVREIAGQLRSLPGDDVAPAHKANFLISLGRLSWAADRYEEARSCHNEAREIFTALQDAGGVGLADMLLGFLDRGDGRIDDAERRFRSGLEASRTSGRLFLEAGCLSGLGSVALDRGDLATARDLKEQSLKSYERMGDHWIVGLILWGITQVAIAQKDYARSASALAQWGRITRDLGNRWILPYILECHADLAIASNNPNRAARLFGASEVLRENLGAQYSTGEQSAHDTSLARLKEMIPEAELAGAWEEGRIASPWDVIDRE